MSESGVIDKYVANTNTDIIFKNLLLGVGGLDFSFLFRDNGSTVKLTSEN